MRMLRIKEHPYLEIIGRKLRHCDYCREPENSYHADDCIWKVARALACFYLGVIDGFADGSLELDYCDFVEIGVKSGLLREEPYDPEIHPQLTEVVPGDMCWFSNFEWAKEGGDERN